MQGLLLSPNSLFLIKRGRTTASSLCYLTKHQLPYRLRDGIIALIALAHHKRYNSTINSTFGAGGIVMEKVLARFRAISEQPYQSAAEWKKLNKGKIIGTLPMYFPDEIIHAAGALPVTLFGNDDEPITLGDKHMMTNACHQVRSSFDLLLKGHYDFLDGIAALHVCDQVRFFLEVWQLDHPLPFFHEMWRPYKLHDTSRPLLAQELKRLLNALEEFTGNKITPDQLLNSIAIYNQSRAMMRQLNQLRSDYPGIISAADMVHVVTSSMLIPREEHNQLLAELLSAIDTTQLPVVNRIRVVAAGHPCDPPEDELLNLIEEQGLVIIDDDFFTGGRYFAEDIKADGDPIDALVDYYMNSTPCSTYHYADDWRREITQTSPYAEYIIDKVKKGQAAGVVILRLMYCDPLDLEFVLLKNRLNQENIPYVSIFTESGPGAFEATRTRIQAFMESL